MNEDLRAFLEQIAEQQKETAAAIEVIRQRENITLEDLESIHKQHLESVYQFDAFLNEAKDE